MKCIKCSELTYSANDTCGNCPPTKKSELSDLLDLLNTALVDWTHTYAPEFCDKKIVAEARKRISDNGGTLAYIANLHIKIFAYKALNDLLLRTPSV